MAERPRAALVRFDVERFRADLQDWLRTAGIGHYPFAQKCGLHGQTIHGILNGRLADLHVDTIASICWVTDRTVDEYCEPER